MTPLLIRRLPIVACTALAAAGFVPNSSQQDGVSITFLANEGVMLSSGGRKILIDALFLKYEREYAVPADSTLASLRRAQHPFDSVDLILVTHRHGDHFHPVPVAEHLRANPAARLLTSKQVIDSLRGYAPARSLSAERLLATAMKPGARRRENLGGIQVELLGLPHVGHPHVQHLGYIVELGGRRVLHVGDTDFSEKTFAPFRLDTARIDVALLPYWAVTSRRSRKVIERWIRPRRVLAVHVGIGEGDEVVGDVRAAMPSAITLVRSLETRRW